MERSLSLVLDEMGNISLTLEKMNARELDKYISKNFNSSEEIRKKYAKSINDFLEQHKEFIAEVEANTNKRYAGSIVIVEPQENSFIKRIKVLYKKDMIIFKEVTKNKKFILAIENRDYINDRTASNRGERYYRIFSDEIAVRIRFYSQTKVKFDRIMGRWRNQIKDYNRYYEIVRIVLKEYEDRYTKLGLDSSDRVYSEYLRRQKKSHENLSADEFFRSGCNSQFFEEPPRYCIPGADPEDYPGDLEPQTTKPHLNTDVPPNDAPTKIKSYKNGNG